MRRPNDGNCQVCGLNYAPWHPPDVRRHRKEHDAIVNGQRWLTMQRETTVRHAGDLRAIAVSPAATLAQRKRVERIARDANQETRYDFAPYHADDAESTPQLNTHAFVAIRNARGVGLLVLDCRDHVVAIPWAEWGVQPPKSREWTSTAARQWTVTFVWTLASMRRTGTASLLLECAAEYVKLAVSDLAWYPPFSPAGEALARARSPERFICGK